jgi:hypothetical protein
MSFSKGDCARPNTTGYTGLDLDRQLNANGVLGICEFSKAAFEIKYGGGVIEHQKERGRGIAGTWKPNVIIRDRGRWKKALSVRPFVHWAVA